MSTTIIYLTRCNHCKSTHLQLSHIPSLFDTPPTNDAPTEQHAEERAAAERIGWYCNGYVDLCPEHAPKVEKGKAKL